MDFRSIGGLKSSAIGLGCMNLSHAYGAPPSEKAAQRVLLEALDAGYSMLDTAALYGFGNNETLLGKTLKGRRSQVLLASKCGIFKNSTGRREINGRPEMIKQTCEDSLKRLQTDVVDLYYLHRWDKNVPIEDSVGALSELVAAGKIREIGLSEVSAQTLRKADAVHPIAAVQTEYSLWTRNPEIAVLDACRELNAAFVAFSPLARAFLTGKLRDVSALPETDLRRNMPRFDVGNYASNQILLDQIEQVAKGLNCSLAQLALAWLLSKADHIIPIPGTTNLDHLRENFSAVDIKLDAEVLARLDEIINQSTVSGARYNVATQAEIDTEEFT
ncbi:MAG: aldo/keto reductase [Halopseudomonas sp.]